MPVTIELFGIPRQRAGVAETTAHGSSLGEVLSDLESRFPGLASACIEEGRLRPGFVANVGGNRFIADPATKITEGDSLLILSADAGG